MIGRQGEAAGFSATAEKAAGWREACVSSLTAASATTTSFVCRTAASMHVEWRTIAAWFASTTADEKRRALSRVAWPPHKWPPQLVWCLACGAVMGGAITALLSSRRQRRAVSHSTAAAHNVMCRGTSSLPSVGHAAESPQLQVCLHTPPTSSNSSASSTHAGIGSHDRGGPTGGLLVGSSPATSAGGSVGRSTAAAAVSPPIGSTDSLIRTTTTSNAGSPPSSICSRLSALHNIAVTLISHPRDWEAPLAKALLARFHEDVATYPVVGLDAEWSRGRRVGLVQLASRRTCWLIRVHEHGSEAIHPSLKAVMAREDVLHCGVGVHGDVVKLREIGVVVAQACDIAKIAAHARIVTSVRRGLESVYRDAIGEPLNKDAKVTTSNWERPQLWPEQLAYAADDAIAGVLIFHAIHARSDAADRPYPSPPPRSGPPIVEDASTAAATAAVAAASPAASRTGVVWDEHPWDTVPQSPAHQFVAATLAKAPLPDSHFTAAAASTNRPPISDVGVASPAESPPPPSWWERPSATLPSSPPPAAVNFPTTDHPSGVVVLSAEGQHIFTCDQNKAKWYTDKKQLAVVTARDGETGRPTEIRLRFVPKTKTKLCMNWQLGSCQFDVNCPFAHGIEQLADRSSELPTASSPPPQMPPPSDTSSSFDGGAHQLFSAMEADDAAAAISGPPLYGVRPVLPTDRCYICLAQGASCTRHPVVPAAHRRLLPAPFNKPSSEDYVTVCSQCLPRFSAMAAGEAKRLSAEWKKLLLASLSSSSSMTTPPPTAIPTGDASTRWSALPPPLTSTAAACGDEAAATPPPVAHFPTNSAFVEHCIREALAVEAPHVMSGSSSRQPSAARREASPPAGGGGHGDRHPSTPGGGEPLLLTPIASPAGRADGSPGTSSTSNSQHPHAPVPGSGLDLPQATRMVRYAQLLSQFHRTVLHDSAAAPTTAQEEGGDAHAQPNAGASPPGHVGGSNSSANLSVRNLPYQRRREMLQYVIEAASELSARDRPLREAVRRALESDGHTALPLLHIVAELQPADVAQSTEATHAVSLFTFMRNHRREAAAVAGDDRSGRVGDGVAPPPSTRRVGGDGKEAISASATVERLTDSEDVGRDDAAAAEYIRHWRRMFATHMRPGIIPWGSVNLHPTAEH